MWVYNGEDRVQDNNKGKTLGLGVTYNHGGAADKFVTLMAFSGAEQNGLGMNAGQGAEGRKRNRLGLDGQWVWGNSTLAFEGEYAQETFGLTTNGKPEGTTKATWSGFGLIYKYQFNDRWAGFARAETLFDKDGVRLVGDSTIAQTLVNPYPGASIQATSGALGAERRWHATFTRIEARLDSLNKNVLDKDGKTYKAATSLTWSVGTSF